MTQLKQSEKSNLGMQHLVIELHVDKSEMTLGSLKWRQERCCCNMQIGSSHRLIEMWKDATRHRYRIVIQNSYTLPILKANSEFLPSWLPAYIMRI